MDPVVVIRLTNVWCYVSNLPDDVRNEVQAKMSYYVPNFKYMNYYKQQQELAESTGIEAWDGTKTVARRWKHGGLQCPSGLYSYLREVLKSRNCRYHLQDERAAPVFSPGWSLEGVQLRDYQQEVEDTALRVQRGVMKMATGGGKTETAISIAVKAAAFPMIFYVPSCDLLEQTYKRFKKYVRYNGQEVEIGRVGAGHCDIQPITIATVQSCQLALENRWTKFDEDSSGDETELNEKQKRDICDLVRQAQFVFVDECQHTSCETVQAILNNSYNARFRIGASASPWRDDGLDLLIESCFGKRLCDIDASFLISNGFLVQPVIVFNHFQQYLGPFATFKACYSQYIVENEARNHWIAERALSHMQHGRPTIILVKWTKHAELLKDLIPGSEVLTSSGKMKRSPKKREKVLDAMRDRQLMCIIGTTLLDEGIDVPAAGAGIFAGGGKSSTRALQRVGRIIRPDKKDASKDTAYIEEFHDNIRWLSHHSKMRRKILQTEPKFIITDNRETLKL